MSIKSWIWLSISSNFFRCNANFFLETGDSTWYKKSQKDKQAHTIDCFKFVEKFTAPDMFLSVLRCTKFFIQGIKHHSTLVYLKLPLCYSNKLRMHFSKSSCFCVYPHGSGWCLDDKVRRWFRSLSGCEFFPGHRWFDPCGWTWSPPVDESKQIGREIKCSVKKSKKRTTKFFFF